MKRIIGRDGPFILPGIYPFQERRKHRNVWYTGAWRCYRQKDARPEIRSHDIIKIGAVGASNAQQHLTKAAVREQAMAETWKPVSGFTGYYEVSDYGRVRSLDREAPQVNRWGQTVVCKRRGRILSPGIDKDGYSSVVLSFQNRKVMRRVHHLVLETFIGDCPPGMQACHNDDDPANNRLSNLRWDTPRGNHADMLKRGTHARGERQGSAKITRSDVDVIRNSNKPVLEIAKEYGISWSQVYAIRSRKRWGWYNADG